MPESTTRSCRRCGQPGNRDNPLSRRRLHAACAEESVRAAAIAMGSRSGAAYERWLASAGPRGRPPVSKGEVPPSSPDAHATASGN